VASFGSGFEGFWDNVEVIPGRFGMLNGLLGCCVWVSCPGIGSRSTPCPLASGEDTVDHVYPIEERIDNEHDGVQPNFKSAQSRSKVKHEKPIQAE